MPLILPKSVFLMVPRAASTWCRDAIRNAGLKYREFGPKHATALPPNAPVFRFCLTREPEAWVKSRWVLGRTFEDELSQFWDLDYAKFRETVNDTAVKMYFAKYTNLCKEPNGYIGNAATAADDLVHALKLAGEEFDETSLRDTSRVNESRGELIPEVFWQMKRDQLGQLPPATIGRLPVELIPRLPPNTLASLPPEVLAPLSARLATEALQAAGASTRRGPV